MIGLLQRVAWARVIVGERTVGETGRGLLVFIAVERGDTEAQAGRLIERLMSYRVFPDADGCMNLGVVEIRGEMLLVSQFTLAADTRKGTRPSFTPAAAPAEAERLFEYCLKLARGYPIRVACGEFGADMQVALVNDGPVTISLRVPPQTAGVAAQEG